MLLIQNRKFSKEAVVRLEMTIKLLKVLAFAGVGLMFLSGSALGHGWGFKLIVEDDNGGNTFGYERQGRQLRHFQATIIISGRCLSSCVAYIGLPRACVMPGAQLMFHHARAATEALRVAGENAVLSTVPPRLAGYWRACINEQDECWITGEQAIAMGAKPCR
jgi:hypothetical protein